MLSTKNSSCRQCSRSTALTSSLKSSLSLICKLFHLHARKLNFISYDFDSDGRITKEDLRIVLSYIPMTVRIPYLPLFNLCSNFYRACAKCLKGARKLTRRENLLKKEAACKVKKISTDYSDEY